jgi:hypothetical protein
MGRPEVCSDVLRRPVGLESVLIWAGAFFGVGTVFAITLCAASDPEALGTRQNDEVVSH